jgi:hypothetical protein
MFAGESMCCRRSLGLPSRARFLALCVGATFYAIANAIMPGTGVPGYGDSGLYDPGKLMIDLRGRLSRRGLESKLSPSLFAWICALPLLLLGTAGCDRGPHTVKASGRVTYEGAPVGKNPTEGFPARISFLPTQSGEGAPLRPASCMIDSDGRYELSSFSANDGVQPGEYDVVVVSILSGPTILNPQAPEIWEIPKRYGRPGDSGLKVTIPDQRAPLTFDFDLEP